MNQLKLSSHDELYKDEIRAVTNQAKVRTNIAENILKELQSNHYFKESKPAIDLEFVELLIDIYDINDVKREIKKATAWLMSNPGREKTNYRRFLTNWMSRKEQKVYIDFER